MSGAHRQARPAVVHQIEIDEFAKRLFERFAGVISGAIGADVTVGACMSERIGSEETGNPIRFRPCYVPLLLRQGRVSVRRPAAIR
jgi:hypothetical protein